MADHESIDERHPVPSDEPVREAAAEVFEVADKESGFSRRTLVRNSLIGALVAFPIPGITLLRGLAPQDQDPVTLLKHTMWEKGTRLSRDLGGAEVGAAIRAADVTIGSVFHVVPENLGDATHVLDEKAKAIEVVKSAVETATGRGVPKWLVLDAGAFKGQVVAVPTREDVPLDINEQLIVELYSK